MSKRQEREMYPLFLTPEQASRRSGLGFNLIGQIMDVVKL